MNRVQKLRKEKQKLFYRTKKKNNNIKLDFELQNNINIYKKTKIKN